MDIVQEFFTCLLGGKAMGQSIAGQFDSQANREEFNKRNAYWVKKYGGPEMV